MWEEEFRLRDELRYAEEAKSAKAQEESKA